MIIYMVPGCRFLCYNRQPSRNAKEYSGLQPTATLPSGACCWGTFFFANSHIIRSCISHRHDSLKALSIKGRRYVPPDLPPSSANPLMLRFPWSVEDRSIEPQPNCSLPRLNNLRGRSFLKKCVPGVVPGISGQYDQPAPQLPKYLS